MYQKWKKIEIENKSLDKGQKLKIIQNYVVLL